MTTINVTPVVNNEAITIRSTGPVAVLTRTSTSTHTIETSSKTFTFSPTNSIGWTIGQRLRAANTVDNWMEGAITSITTSTVVILVDAISGSGSLSSWNIGLSGQKGADGSPDTAAQIVTKLESIAVEEEKPEKTVIKNFDTEVDGRINTIVYPPDDDQMFLNGGKITIGTLFKKITSIFPTVTTEFSKIQGSRNAPQYHFLSLPISLTTAQKKWLNKVKVVHSGLVVPSVLVPNKPQNNLPNYDSQALMTADFANQTAGQYYSYTGSTSMWEYDGTATDSIDNYTELEAVAGWETWGAKPSYLIVQGDAYLVGENNVNELDFVYHELIKIDSVSYADVVVVTNTSHGGMNAQSPLTDINTLIKLEFNENVVLEDNDVFNNSSFYGGDENFVPVIVSGADKAEYIDLGGGEFSLRLNTVAFSNATAARIQLGISDIWRRLLIATQELSVIMMVRRVSAADTFNITLVSAYNSAISQGWRLQFETSSNRLNFRRAGTNTRTTDGNIPIATNQAEWIKIAVTYNRTTGVIDFYAKAPTYTVPLDYTQQVTSAVDHIGDDTVEHAMYLNYEGPNNSGARNNVEYKFFRISNKKLSSTEVNAIFDAY